MTTPAPALPPPPPPPTCTQHDWWPAAGGFSWECSRCGWWAPKQWGDDARPSGVLLAEAPE